MYAATTSPQNTKLISVSREVPNEHDHLKTMIQGLLLQIHTAMSAMDELQQEEEILERLQLEIPDLGSQEFTYTIKVVNQRRMDIDPGEYATNCIRCNFTCHYSCKIQDDANLWQCAAMNSSQAGDNSVCQVCPGQCEWQKHCNNSRML